MHQFQPKNVLNESKCHGIAQKISLNCGNGEHSWRYFQRLSCLGSIGYATMSVVQNRIPWKHQNIIIPYFYCCFIINLYYHFHVNSTNILYWSFSFFLFSLLLGIFLLILLTFLFYSLSTLLIKFYFLKFCIEKFVLTYLGMEGVLEKKIIGIEKTKKVKTWYHI